MAAALLKRLNQADMQKKGLKLTAEEIYDVNNACLKDAVVQLGGFCTGEFVSSQGLLLTNHHCGYDAIQSHSTPQNNILQNGFFAATKADEKKNPGLFVDILVRMEDVTAKMTEGLSATTPEAERMATIQQRQREMAEAAKENGQYVAYVRDMFGGNEYYLFIYQRFGDVRLVGAPPEAVGKFGGDTDNWMWPRHTGDFSMFRVYADKDNKPTAGPQDGNVPYVPKKHLPVALQGVQRRRLRHGVRLPRPHPALPARRRPAAHPRPDQPGPHQAARYPPQALEGRHGQEPRPAPAVRQQVRQHCQLLEVLHRPE